MTSRCLRIEKSRGDMEWHEYSVDGKHVPGVTSVIGAVVDKPGLRGWYAQQAALWALEQGPESLRAMPEDEMLKLAKDAPNQRRDKAAKQGKTLHAYAEALQRDEEIEPDSELAGRAGLIAEFLDAFKVRILAAETTVWHEGLRYAGTLDLLADLYIGGRWTRWLLDYKTGNWIGHEAVLQQAAYRYATHAVVDGNDVPMATVDAAGIVHVTPGGWALKPVAADKAAFDAFTHGVSLHRFLKTPIRQLVHEPVMTGEPS